MVATMAQAAAASYYMESQRSFRHPTEYYTAGTEPDGVWFNPNDLLGLADANRIDSKHFLRLYSGFHPETGEKLTRNAGSDTRSPGLDITFSADKSVSALWAIAGDDLRNKIEDAHNRAARMALQEIFLKECSYTRTRVGGADGDIHVIPAHLIGAMFQHGTSRADDPQLHTHCVIFNAVQTEQDGKWRALHQKPLYNWVKASGAYYRAFLSSNLTELGIGVERYGKDNAFVRIKNIPRDLEKLWSKRRAEIVETAAEMGFETGDNSRRAEMVNLMTRESKRTDQEPEQRHFRWREESEALYQCAAILASVFEEPEEVTQDRIREWAESLDELPHVLTRLRAVFRKAELAEAVANLRDPALGTLHPETIESAIQRILRNPELVALDRQPRTPESIAGLSHTVPLSTRHTLQMEQETRDLALAMSQRSAFALPADAIEEKLQQLKAERYPLSDEQTSAIRYVTGRAGGISIVEGAAGSGKTTTMRPIVDLYKQHGYSFVAAAIAWRTAVELANDCDIPPYACDKLLKDASRGKLHLDEKSIIIVEEAGMISTRHTNRILKLAQESGAKVIFLGDTQQQQPSKRVPDCASSTTSREATGSIPCAASCPTRRTICATSTASIPPTPSRRPHASRPSRSARSSAPGTPPIPRPPSNRGRSKPPRIQRRQRQGRHRGIPAARPHPPAQQPRGHRRQARRRLAPLRHREPGQVLPRAGAHPPGDQAALRAHARAHPCRPGRRQGRSDHGQPRREQEARILRP